MSGTLRTLAGRAESNHDHCLLTEVQTSASWTEFELHHYFKCDKAVSTPEPRGRLLLLHVIPELRSWDAAFPGTEFVLFTYYSHAGQASTELTAVYK